MHDDALLSRDIYVKTPSHCFGNHQSNVRFWAKMRLVLGLCSRIATRPAPIRCRGEGEARPDVRGRGIIAGMVHGQIDAFERWPEGYVCFNRRMMYAGARMVHAELRLFIDKLRELCGGGVFQMPAESRCWTIRTSRASSTPTSRPRRAEAVTRMKLFKLAWDLAGSEFAGRHLQYEKFYAGASFIVRNHAYRETAWNEFHALVDKLMAGYEVPDKGKQAAE